MVAASAADIDAVSSFFGDEAYWDWHHLRCHNLAFALILSAPLAAFSTLRIKAFFVYLALAHLHLILDYLGSGPGWPIHYGWPLFHCHHQPRRLGVQLMAEPGGSTSASCFGCWGSRLCAAGRRSKCSRRTWTGALSPVSADCSE